jgi:hypothetical protein
MEKFALNIFSLKFNTVIEIGYSEDISQVIFDFISIFNADINAQKHSINIDAEHQYTDAMKKLINEYIEKYKNVSPAIQQITKYFKKLEDNEYFYILHPELEINTKIKYELEKELSKLNGIADYSEEEKLKLKQFDCIMNNYEIKNFDLEKDKIMPIGTRQKDKRICRFCKKSKPDVSFDNIAHAISEGLGNKKLILNEECDDCNKFFDENIERDFIYYHDLARTTFGIKNKKNNIPKMKGKNFQYFKDEEDEKLSIMIQENNEYNKSEPPKNILLKTGNKIKIQNIYKTLCKFSLSVIDEKYIKDFDETIDWLYGKKEIAQLPKIAVLNDYHFFTKVPDITLYCRNNNRKDIPYIIGEFKFTYYMYIFIIPFSKEDEKDFLDENDYSNFLECFQHVKNIKKFNYLNFSSNIEKELNFNINFEQRKD